VIYLESADTLSAEASAATSVTVTVYGRPLLLSTFAKLDQRQLTTGTQTLYTSSGTETNVDEIVLVNTSGSAVTVTMWHDGVANSNMILPPISLGAGEFAIYNDQGWNFYTNTGQKKGTPTSVPFPVGIERFNAGADTLTNLGAGPTEANAENRFVVDLTRAIESRVVGRVQTAGATGELRAQYSTDGTTFADLTTTFTLASTGLKASSWSALPAGAKALVSCRIVGVNGNGTEDPVYSSGVCLEWR
jgi:hypothetical protein